MKKVLASVNSVLVAAAGAGVVLGSVGTLLVLSGALQPGEVPPFSWFSQHLESVDALGGSEAAVAWVLAIVAALLGIVVALANLGSLLTGREPPALTIVEDDHGLVTMARRSAEEYLALAARTVSAVEQVAVRARPSRQGGIEINAELGLKPGLDVAIPPTTLAARQAMLDAATEGIGLEVEGIDLQASLKRPPRGRRRSTTRPRLD